MSGGARTEWGWLKRWSGDELAQRLERAVGLPLNFNTPWEAMTLENGWNQVESQAVIAREPTGPPGAGGTFERARQALLAFAFSEPRIVEGYFRADAPLDGRHVLLVLKPMGVRFVCPVRVGAVREEADAEESVFGYCYDTLQGNIEMGREWFLLTKEHRTGLLRFRIEAAWRPGNFPTWWSRLGFHLLGRRYQRAWHHLAHVRLRELLRRERLPDVHGPHPLEHHPIFIYSQRVGGRRLSAVEREVERVRRDGLLTTVGLGTLAGMRSLSTPALLCLRLAHDPEPHTHGLLRLLSSRWAGRVLGALAAGEVVTDKLPWVPARVAPVSLGARALSGALAGATVAARGRRPLASPALVGAAAAVASSFAFFALRTRASRRLGVSSALAGLFEDALAVALGARLLAALR